MGWIGFVVCLYFCFVLVCPASLRPASEHLFMSDLSPYNSVHGPEQIHIAYGNSPSEMTVVWSTSAVQELSSSFVLYGLAPKNYSLKAEGKFVVFTEGNPDGLHYVHRVVLEVRLTILAQILLNAVRNNSEIQFYLKSHTLSWFNLRSHSNTSSDFECSK